MVIFIESNKDVLNRFIRFGKMDSFQVQNVHVRKGLEPSSIHIAPKKRGFYAMPLKFQEMFLISSLETTQRDTFPKQKGEPNEELSKKVNYIKHNLIRHSFALKDSDLLWHHLHILANVPNNEIERRSGDWILTSVFTFKKAIGKAIAKLGTDFGMHRGNINLRKLDKDSFEVFIPAGVVK